MNIMVHMIREQIADHERKIEEEVEAIGKLSAMEALALALPSGQITEEDVARVAAAEAAAPKPEPRANMGSLEDRQPLPEPTRLERKGAQMADAVLEVAGRHDPPNGDDPDARAEEETPENVMRPTLVEVLDYLRANGPARAGAIADAVGRGSATVHADCEVLVASDHLTRDQIGRYDLPHLEASD